MTLSSESDGSRRRNDGGPENRRKKRRIANRGGGDIPKPAPVCTVRVLLVISGCTGIGLSSRPSLQGQEIEGYETGCNALQRMAMGDSCKCESPVSVSPQL